MVQMEPIAKISLGEAAGQKDLEKNAIIDLAPTDIIKRASSSKVIVKSKTGLRATTLFVFRDVENASDRLIDFNNFCLVNKAMLNKIVKNIYNAEKVGKRQVLIRPNSKVVVKFLTVMMKKGYIGEFEIVDDHRSGKIVIELTGRINKCGVISPRFDVELGDIESWINNLLPSRQFGHLVLSTTFGIMDHEEARRKRTGGKILGFFY